MKIILKKFTAWIIRNIVVIVSLLIFFYSMWNFLVGNNYFSSDFYHLHLPFEYAFKSLDNNLSFPTWLLFFQGGKGIFGDIANSYSPFGIDFIFTYVLAKLFCLDKLIGLVLINTWRMVLLCVLFAVGCRKLAREILRFRYSADLVFLVSLFSGEFFLSHRPIFVMCNIFSPWVLLYITRMAKGGRDRLLHNMAGFVLTTVLSVFHQYNIQSTLIWPYIFFYLIGLCMFGFGKSFLQIISSLIRSSLRIKIGHVIVFTAVVISILPLLWEFKYFSEYNKKMIYPGEPLDVVKRKSAYTIEDFQYEHFEWQKLLSLFYPYPSTLEKVTDVKDGMQGFFVHNFQYFGILTALLIIVGLLFGRNRFKLPIFFGIVFYLLFFTVNRSPIFSLFFRLHHPMTRHFLFGLLHLTPLLTILSGMGMDRVLKMGVVRRWGKRDVLIMILETMGIKRFFRVPMTKKWSRIKILTAIIIFSSVLLLAVYGNEKIVNEKDIVTAGKGYICSIIFVLVSLVAFLLSFIVQKRNFTVFIFSSVILLDLFIFNSIGQNYIITTGRTNISHIYTQAVTYDFTLEDISLFDNYAQYTLLKTDAYSIWEKPEFYFPVLFKYAIIGNKSFYDVMLNSTTRVRDMISGYLLPRLFIVDNAIEDSSGDIARKVLSSEGASDLVDEVIFINDKVNIGREALIMPDDLSRLGYDRRVEIVYDMNFHKIGSFMVTSNIGIDREIIAGMFTGDSKLLRDSIGVIGAENNWWIQIDFGSDGEEVINFIDTKDEHPFNGRVVFFDGSHDGIKWKRIGYLTHDSDNVPPWHILNEDSYRFYKIFIRDGGNSFNVNELPELRLGYEGRRLISGYTDRFSARIPLLRFTNEGLSPNGKYYIFSYYLKREIGVDLTTEPSQRFGYKYSLKWAGEDMEDKYLCPTWHNEWHSDNLFQLNYKIDGCLSINIPVGRVIKFRKKILEVDIKSSDTGVRVLDYSANGIRVLVDRPKPGWLYYADTWDKYWKTYINGRPVPLHKANLQFKAVFVPAGRQVIEIEHRPISFLRIIGLSYILQFIVLIIWLRT